MTTQVPRQASRKDASNGEKLRILPRYGGASGPPKGPQHSQTESGEVITKAGRGVYTKRAGRRIDSIPEGWQYLAERFKRTLEGQNKSPGTIDSYLEALQRVTLYMNEKGMPAGDDPEQVNSEYIEAYFADLIRQGSSPNTARIRFASLRVFFKWAEKIGEIRPNPMANLQSPKPVEVLKPVYILEDIQAMLNHCGDDFTGRRDKAAIMVLFDCGLRASEFLSLTMDDVDLREGVLLVRHAKTNRQRAVAFSEEAETVLNRYIRARKRVPTDHNALWVTSGGKEIGMEALRSLVQRHGAAGLHIFRHSSATAAARNRLGEIDMLRTFGWTSIQMAKRYTEALGAQLSADAKRRASPGRGLRV